MIGAALRNGIKSTLRARKRSVLFLFLLALLTFLLTVGMGFYLTADQLVKQSNETFVSSIRLEYLGEDYPNRTVYDSYVEKAYREVDPELWKEVPGIRSWNPTNGTLCYTEGYHRSYGEKGYVDWGVFVLSNIRPRPEASRYGEGYSRISCIAIVDRDLSETDEITGKIVKVELPSGISLRIGGDDKYIVHARMVENNSVTPSMRTIRIEPFLLETDESPVHRLTGDGDPYLTEGIFYDQARMYYGANNYIVTRAAESVKALDEFEQAEVTLAEGRFPEAHEAGTCVVSGGIAVKTEWKLGDEITLHSMYTKNHNYFNLWPGETVKTLKIVGITEENSAYEGNIWVSDAEANPDPEIYGYELGVIHIDNDEGPAAADKIAELVPDQVSVTLWDQGYKGAIDPIKTMRTVALAVVIAIAAGLVSTVILFAFLMITRQRETYDVMKNLGTSGGGVFTWFLAGVLMIAVPAAAIGCVGGIYLLKAILSLVFEKLMGIEQVHYYFSETVMGLKRELPVPKFFDVPAGIFVAGAVVVLTLLACAVAVYGMRKETEVSKGSGKIRPARKDASMFGFGSLRYAVLSIRRNSFRSVITPVVTCVLACIIGYFSFLQTGTDTQIEELYNKSAIEGRVSSMDGTTVSGLAVQPYVVRHILSTGVADNIGVSFMPGWHYWVSGKMPDFGNSFSSGDRKYEWIMNRPQFVAVNHMNAAKAFYFSDPTIDWLEGYDASMLECEAIEDLGDPDLKRSGSNRVWPVVVSKEFMEEYGYSLGDIVPFEYAIFSRIVNGYPQLSYYSIKGKITGSFAQSGDNAHIYLPMCFVINPSWLFTPEEPQGAPVSWTLNTCRFDIDPASDLEDFRNAMWELGYSEPEHMRTVRTAILLKDRSFTEAVSSLRRFSLITNLLLPILMGVICLIGFLVSWLLIHGRKMEFAMMRGFGVRYGRTNMSFLWEQIILVVLGVGAAALILYLTKIGSVRTWIYLGVFTVMYLDGASIAIRLIAKGSLMRLLQGNE